MKQPHPLLKLAALVSSVLLAVGFISYRAGAFDWLRVGNPPEKETPERAIMGGSKSKLPAVHGDFSGSYTSKWGPILPVPPSEQPSPTTQPAPTFMGSSKSVALPEMKAAFLKMETAGKRNTPPPAPPQPSARPK